MREVPSFPLTTIIRSVILGVIVFIGSSIVNFVKSFVSFINETIGAIPVVGKFLALLINLVPNLISGTMSIILLLAKILLVIFIVIIIVKIIARIRAKKFNKKQSAKVEAAIASNEQQVNNTYDNRIHSFDN